MERGGGREGEQEARVSTFSTIRFYINISNLPPSTSGHWIHPSQAIRRRPGRCRQTWHILFLQVWKDISETDAHNGGTRPKGKEGRRVLLATERRRKKEALIV